MFSFSSWNDHRRYYSLYFALIIAYVLLDLTNATNTTVDNKANLRDQLVTSASQFEQSTESVATTTTTTNAINGSINATEPSLFHKPQNMSDVQRILLALVRLFAQAFLIVSS